MNGIINGSSIFGNNGFFPNPKKIKSDTNKTTEHQDIRNKKRAFKNELDSVDISGTSREVPQAGYSKPVMKVSDSKKEDTTYKPIDSNGIQEGIKLSDNAKNLLKELQEKYGDNMDIYVANWNSDEEQDYYSGLSDKRFSALINPELLEDMANDEAVREKYESILSSAGETSSKITEELGEEVSSKIKSFTVSIDSDGNVSYIVSLLKDFTAKNTQSAKKLEERQIEKREEKRTEEKRKAKKEEEDMLYEKISAGSIDELISKLKEKFNYASADDVVAKDTVEANE